MPTTSSSTDKQPDSQPKPADDWRKTVSQSYRSSEIREISKVLAALEPGATVASKMMLAMRFEDTIFQSSDSLADYRKRLTKRLKKLQKSYVPMATPAPAKSGASPSTASSKGPGKTALDKKEEERLERELRQKYGDRLIFIVQNAAAAVEALREKHGSDRADHLKQHTNSVRQWAVEIGLIPEQRTATGHYLRKHASRDASFFERLKQHLEQRVENIRRHVLNLTQPDRFLEETLCRVEQDMNASTSDELTSATLKFLKERMGLASPPAVDASDMKKLMERASVVVPPPRTAHEEDIKNACVAYLEKIRVACQIMISYMALKADVKAEFKGVLKRAHTVALEGLAFLSEHYKDETKHDTATPALTLEDAWTKPLQYVPVDNHPTELDHPQDQTQPPAKRRKSIIVQTRVLLKPGRKIPANLLAALESKKANLIRPNGVGPGARLRTEFGDAFEMILFFSPLMVTIRALPAVRNRGEDVDEEGKSRFWQCIVNGSLPTFTPPECNLMEAPPSVCNMSGAALSSIATQKLEFASSRATSVLRKCFSDIAGKCYAQAKSDFEIEISEATALLRFLSIVRSTYLGADEA